MMNIYAAVLLAFSSLAGSRAPKESLLQPVLISKEVLVADGREKSDSLFAFVPAHAMEADNNENSALSITDAAPVRAIITRKMTVTAYSSTPEETDDTPFITASGMHVRDGIVATNQLPFGTNIRIPEHFGDKIFVVQDRMHRRKKNNIDVWMSSKEKALRFGITAADVIILD